MLMSLCVQALEKGFLKFQPLSENPTKPNQDLMSSPLPLPTPTPPTLRPQGAS